MLTLVYYYSSSYNVFPLPAATFCLPIKLTQSATVVVVSYVKDNIVIKIFFSYLSTDAVAERSKECFAIALL